MYKFFLKKVYGGRVDLSIVLDENGLEVNGKERVGEEVCKFYVELYKEKKRDARVEKDVLKQVEMCLDLDDKSMLGEKVSKEEVDECLGSMKKGKTPGSDGLPVEFYCAFWDVIGDCVYEMVMKVLEDGRMPESMLKSVIVLLYKKGDKHELKNWRPISLLNVDYKVVAKVLANRLRAVAEKLVGEEQVCAVPGRSIAESLVSLRDVLWLCKERRQEVAVLAVDFEKAFDRASHEFMFKVLRRMGIPEVLIGWIKCLYRGMVSKVLLNGWLTNDISIGSGVRQGCPLSPVLFVCVIEPLLRMLAKDKCVRGVRFLGVGVGY